MLLRNFKMPTFKTFHFVFTSHRDLSSSIQLVIATVQGGREGRDCDSMQNMPNTGTGNQELIVKTVITKLMTQ